MHQRRNGQTISSARREGYERSQDGVLPRAASGLSSLIKVHLARVASRLTALLLPRILPVFSIVAPGSMVCSGPIVSISTGTNNVFPTMVEGTIAGLAAGLVARGIVDGPVVHRTTRLDILRDGEPVDIALVDAVAYSGQFIGSRAIWEAEGVRQIVLTRADPYSIGLSSIGGNLDAFDLGRFMRRANQGSAPSTRIS